MAEIEVTIPTVPYGNIKLRAETAREMNLVFDDLEFYSLREKLVALRAPQGPVGANVTPGDVLAEDEALDALKEALGASEAVENSPEGQDAKAALATAVAIRQDEELLNDPKAAFLAKFGRK
jgi:hypothetical protein